MSVVLRQKNGTVVRDEVGRIRVFRNEKMALNYAGQRISDEGWTVEVVR